MNPEIIGTIAATLTTASYIPQTIKIFREKHTTSISLGMYVMITGGIFLWFIYGVMIGSPSIMFANGITTILSGAILYMKIKHG